MHYRGRHTRPHEDKTMTVSLRQHGDDILAAQRAAATLAAAEGAAIRGELGIETQLIAMSALYTERLARGDVMGALALKAKAKAISEARELADERAEVATRI
jgi:hypothetical protein